MTQRTRNGTGARRRGTSVELTLEATDGGPMLPPPTYAPVPAPAAPALVQQVTMQPLAALGEGGTDTAGTCSPSILPSDAQDPAPDDGDDLFVPMLQEPTRLPGIRYPSFSPAAFYALSRIERPEVDTSDEGLWLHEAPCPKVEREGISLGGRKFFHPDLQTLVDTVPVTGSRKLLIRYNRALLARGVLQEVIVCYHDGQRVVELVRCKTRDQALQELDYNVVVAERQRLLRVLRAKHNLAHEEVIGLQAGTAALERFRDEQAARARRQQKAKHAPKVATPRLVTSARLEEEARARVEQESLSAYLGPEGDHDPVATDEAVGPVATATAGPETAPAQDAANTPRATHLPRAAKVRQPGGSRTRARRTSAPVAADVEGVGTTGRLAPPEPSTNAEPDLRQLLGGRTGFDVDADE